MSDPLPEHLMQQLEAWRREHPQLDPEEHKIVLEVVDAWRGWKAIGRVLRWLVLGLGTAAAAVVALDQLAAKLKSLMTP